MMSAEGDDKYNNDAMISFGDDDDDEMLDLFSFGAEPTITTTTTSETMTMGDNTTTTTTTTTGLTRDNNNNNNNKGPKVVDYSEVMKSVMPLPPVADDDRSNASEDSFLELLEQQQVTVVDAAAIALASKNKSTTSNAPGSTSSQGDSDMQEVLDWLDDDDERGRKGNRAEEEELIFFEPPRPPPLMESIPRPEPPPPPPKVYESLEEAVKAHDSTITQIRRAMEKEQLVVKKEVRPWLWAKVICNKTLEETLESSIADSFQQWEEQWQASLDDTENGATKESDHRMQKDWIEKESKILAERIVVVLDDKQNLEEHQKDLMAVLINHEGSKASEDDHVEAVDENNIQTPTWKDPLLPPVACAILSAGVPKPAAAVMLSQIVSKFMPIVSLSVNSEREQAAGILHRQFYLLACYHLPYLVLHLDKYIPDWCKWPPIGILPQSWLVSHLAGETDGAPMINPQLLLCLWDLILTSSNNSLRFFLVMAILDRHAERLLLLTDDNLEKAFREVLSFSTHENEESDGFVVSATIDLTDEEAGRRVREWSDKALGLWEETPLSVTRKLKRLEDEAVTDALIARQKAKEERLRIKQETEAKAQQEAMEAEREKKADEARLRLTRARLVAFYRQHNPGKETNIDKIMKTYEDRYDVLDSKLKQKYGVGFNPALKPKPIAVTKNNSNILSSMNTGFGGRFGKRQEESSGAQEHKKIENVVVEVAPDEVMTAICWSKEANQIKLEKLKKSSKLEDEGNQGTAVKFYLVDCRPEKTALEQGRIPTSVSLTPDQLLDVDKIKEQEDMFESLRGSVHICVMGEGYSCLPSLYGHKMTKGLSEFIREDEARTNECAQFFLSRGFPFVSILEGGFAAAHAFLCREGPKVHLHPKNVLTDYDPEVSMFAQFERVSSGTGREKTQRSLQNIFDSSMTAITKNTMRLESLASELSNGGGEEKPQQKSGQRNVVSRFFGGNKEDVVEEKETKPPEENYDISKQEPSQPSVPFRNPFARKQGLEYKDSSNVSTKEFSADSVVVETEDVDNPKSGPMPAFDKAKELNPLSKATSTETSETNKANPFAGFGAALNIASNPTNRNPFARFGNLGSNPIAKQHDSKGSGMGNHFAGLNQFRKNTLAIMKTGEHRSAPQQTTSATENSEVQDSGNAAERSSSSTAQEKDEQESSGQAQPSTPHIAQV
jgi:hypothetical protein